MALYDQYRSLAAENAVGKEVFDAFLDAVPQHEVDIWIRAVRSGSINVLQEALEESIDGKPAWAEES